MVIGFCITNTGGHVAIKSGIPKLGIAKISQHHRKRLTIVTLDKLKPMKTITVIYHANGENQGTYAPLCFAENFTGNFAEKTQRFISHDFDQTTEVDLYKKRVERIPSWMQERDYLSREVELKYCVALAGDCVLSFEREQFDRFAQLSDRLRYWYGWAQNQKSPFIGSLLNQFNAWLNGQSNHPSPLSPAQFEAGSKFCPLYKAKKISEKLYYSFNKMY